MKVVVLEQSTKERSLIQNALGKSGHTMLLGESVEQVARLIAAGEARFAIIDFDMPGVREFDLIKHLRSAVHASLYFLAVTSAEDDPNDADDTLHKPLTLSELRARIMIGQRFLSLGDSLSQARDQIENMAVYDPLTGLMNRSALFRTAQGELERARRTSSALSLIALDIDKFKSLNEAHGIQMGDETLKVIAQSIREKSRPYDCIGRWSGDEFIIILPGVIGADAEKITDRIIRSINSTHITYKEDMVNVSVSAGIASTTNITSNTDLEPLIEKARQAMQRAKEAGGNQINLVYL